MARVDTFVYDAVGQRIKMYAPAGSGDEQDREADRDGVTGGQAAPLGGRQRQAQTGGPGAGHRHRSSAEPHGAGAADGDLHDLVPVHRPHRDPRDLG